MEREDIQKTAEELFSLQIQSSEASDREDYGAAHVASEEADSLELSLRGEGYTIEEDSDDMDIMHIVASDGTRYASFDLAEWQWVRED